jgi:hypothetical protein
MTPSPRLRFAVLALAIASVSPSVGARGGPHLPYRLNVVVEEGRSGVPDSFLDDLEHEIVARLATTSRFREVSHGIPASPGEDDLMLRVVVHSYKEVLDFEFGVSDQDSPDRDKSQLTVARIGGTFQVEIRAADADAAVRERRFHHRSSWRPVIDEDPRGEAQLRLIDSVARTTRKFACKGSPASWSKELAQARDASTLTP